MMGDPTDGTLVVAAAKAGFERTELEHYPCISEVLFTSERKRVTTVN